MHIDARSYYSFHDGVASPAELCAHAAELGFTELGMADVDGAYGLIHMYKAALKCGVKPVLGIALTDGAEDTAGAGRGPAAVTRSGASEATTDGAGDGTEPAGNGAEPAAWVFAQDRDGYSELCRLAALRQGCVEEEHGGRGALPPRRNWDLARALRAHTHHCYVVSGRAGVLAALAPQLGPERVFARLDADYGGTGRARQIDQLKLAARFKLRPVACTDVRFLRPQDQVVHHTLRAIGQNATLHTAQRVRNRDHYLAAPTELAGYYYNCPEALAHARALAERCNVDFELGRWVFPRYELPGGGEPRGALAQLCRRGLNWRGIDGGDQTYAARLEMELRVIEELGYSSYFLAVYDIVREAKRRRIPHIGRGSAANSLVSYLLGLTPVDPLRYDMYFERFLNPQRTSPPDIDIDFSWKRRDEILGYVYERWGGERVAMISTHVTYRARSALREVAKVFGLGDAEISTVSKFLPHISAAGLPSAQREFPELRGVDFVSEPYCHVLPLASRLDGKPRHLGIHCGGVVIAPTRITDYTGLQRAAKGFVVTQYDMFPVEDVGLIKIDLLGNRSLGVLEDVLAALEDPVGRTAVSAGRADRRVGHTPGNGGLTGGPAVPAAPQNCRLETGAPRPDIRRMIGEWEVLATDPATVELVREGLTMGCFYIESPGMRQLLRRLRTQTFLDLTAASSVIRPGVAESGMMQEYIRRVRGEAPRAASHPLLVETMPETHGVMIYQEDVIKVAHRVAGMSLADADLLRRAMSGKLRSQQAMNQLRERFISGCEQRGVDLASALEIWRQIASFAGYSFCKAHSASFATLSFQVAWLKAHHPAVFMAAVLSNGGGFYGPRAYLSECERLGLAILAPDVNHSRLEFTPECLHQGQEPDAVRIGLALLKGVSAALLERVVQQRQRGGPYRSLPDFIRRTRPGETDLGVLIRAGTLDSLGLTRPELLWLAQMERKAALRTGDMVSTRRQKSAGQRAAVPVAPKNCRLETGPSAAICLPQPLPFDESARIADFRERLGATLDDYDELKLCELELEHLGLLVTRHPLTLYQHLVSGVVNARDLPRYTGKWVRLLGWCIATKRVDLSRRQAVRDTLELLAEHADMPEPSETDGSFEDEREGTAEDLGIVLRNPRAVGRTAASAVGASPTQTSASAPGGDTDTPARRAMKFMSMEDLTGTYEVTLFADAYARYAPLTRYAGPFLVTGRVEEQFDTYTVNATELRLLRLDDDGSTITPPGPARSQSIRSAGRAKGGG